MNYGTLAGWRKFRLRRESGLTNEILMEIERLKKKQSTKKRKRNPEEFHNFFLLKIGKSKKRGRFLFTSSSVLTRKVFQYGVCKPHFRSVKATFTSGNKTRESRKFCKGFWTESIRFLKRMRIAEEQWGIKRSFSQ